ncbi:MAG: hypothetical protein O3C21_07190 [Verrucomicrobia bacterium]|nr:hypothetical protein [Verrucomicrobiota bacterium]
MSSNWVSLLVMSLLTGLQGISRAGDAADKFAAACAEARATASDKKWFSVQGDAPEWLFLARELEHVAQGEFWQKAGKADLPDPTPVIVQYSKDLKAKGIELLLVPVPAKAAMVPEKFRKSSSRKDGGVYASAPFYEQLRAAGVNVLDLEPIFEKGIADGQKLYCEQDTHWSPLACELVAAEINALYQGQPWAAANAAHGIVRGEKSTLSIKGDLVEERLAGLAEEKLEIVKAGKDSGAGKIVPVPASDDSPVILLGDSHTLVFSEGGEMHCTGAGLPDHLQQQFGFPLSQIAVKASGADAARARLVRDFARKNPNYLVGKKLLIWCFTAREFTLGKWRPIPAG